MNQRQEQGEEVASGIVLQTITEIGAGSTGCCRFVQGQRREKLRTDLVIPITSPYSSNAHCLLQGALSHVPHTHTQAHARTHAVREQPEKQCVRSESFCM